MNYSKQENTKRRKKIKSKKKKVKNKVGSLIFRIVIAALLIGMFAGGGALVGAYMGILENAPPLENIVIQPDIYTTIIYSDKTGQEIDRLKGEENREYVTFDKVPQNLKDAVVAIEDERFYSHDGVDFRALLRIVYVNIENIIKGNSRREGASTITQQVIKNNVMNLTRNTPETKLQEQYLAFNYEKKLVEQFKGNKKAAKDYILETYLNTIGLHHNIYGVQTASGYYFGKDVSELSLSEAAVIAGITQFPAQYAPDVNPEQSRKRQMMVLNKMRDLNFITKAEYDDAVADDVFARVTGVRQTDDTPIYHSDYTDSLIDAVSKDLQDKYKISSATASNWIFNSGLKIYSLQDLEFQQIMDNAFKDDSMFPAAAFAIDIEYSLAVKNTITNKVTDYYREKTVKKEEDIQAFVDSVKNEVLGANDEVFLENLYPIPQPQAAMVIMDNFTGEVRALISGRGEKLTNRGLNRATNSVRQPGSVFKVLASYAAGIDLLKITPATLIEDAPFEVNGHEFKNWYRNPSYRGWSSVRSGIRDSMNVITVKNMMINTGLDACFEYLKNFGFTTLVENEVIRGELKTDRVPAASLGGITKGVTQIELAAAYGAIANGGVYNKPILYSKVLDHNNEILLENVPEPKQILKKESAYLLTDMMKDVVRSGTGTKAALKKSKMPVAGKTGTTSDDKDLMFVGYTPYYTASIWTGYDMPQTIKESSNYHLLLWSRVMDEISANQPVKDFVRPENVITASTCKASGKRVIKGLCDKDIHRGFTTEIFIAGTEPKETCDVHVALTLDSSTGEKFGPNCPEVYKKEVIGIISATNPYDIADYYFKQSFIDGPTCRIHAEGRLPIIDNEPDVPEMDILGDLEDEDEDEEKLGQTTTSKPSPVIPTPPPELSLPSTPQTVKPVPPTTTPSVSPQVSTSATATQGVGNTPQPNTGSPTTSPTPTPVPTPSSTSTVPVVPKYTQKAPTTASDLPVIEPSTAGAPVINNPTINNPVRP